MVDRLTKSMLGRHGFVHGTIATKWPDIVGDDIARHTQPEKIVFSRDGVSGGTLHLRCASGAFATEIQHLEPQILDRINAFFGYNAIVRIKLSQAPLPARPGRRASKSANPSGTNLDPEQAKEVENTVAKTVQTVDDDELREALGRLGQSILGRESEEK